METAGEQEQQQQQQHRRQEEEAPTNKSNKNKKFLKKPKIFKSTKYINPYTEVERNKRKRQKKYLAVARMVRKITGARELSQHIVDQNWAGVLQLVRSNPKTLQQWSSREGFFEGIKTADVLPIHEVCSDSSTPIDVVTAIIDGYPEGLDKKETAYNRLPLHIACRKNANVDVIKLLMERSSKAALEADILGRLPIHYALSNAVADDVIVDLFLKKEPNCARGFDRRGWIPLHVACSNGSSTRVIQALLNAHPDSIIETTNKGSTPLSCITTSKAPNKDEVTRILSDARQKFEANWRVAQKRDPNDLAEVV